MLHPAMIPYLRPNGVKRRGVEACCACRLRRKSCQELMVDGHDDPHSNIIRGCYDCARFNISCQGQGKDLIKKDSILNKARYEIKLWIKDVKNRHSTKPLDLTETFVGDVGRRKFPIGEMEDVMDYLPANRNHDDFLFVRQHGSQMFPLPHSDTPATTETFTSFPASGQPPLLQTPPPFDTYFPPPPYDAFTYAENPSQSQPYLSDFERNELIFTAYGPNAGLPANLGLMDGQLQFESAPPTSGTMPWLPTDGFMDGLLGPVFASDTTPYLTADGLLDGSPQAGPEPTAPTFTFDTTPLWPAGDGGFPFDETLSWSLGMM